MDYNKFPFFEFKLKSMVMDRSICMIAKRGSGKSWITRDIVYFNRHIPCGLSFPQINESILSRILFRSIYSL